VDKDRIYDLIKQYRERNVPYEYISSKSGINMDEVWRLCNELEQEGLVFNDLGYAWKEYSLWETWKLCWKDIIRI